MFPAQLMPRAVELVQGPGRVSPLFILSCLCRGPCRGARSLSLSGFTCPFCVQPTWSESWLCHGVLVAMGTGMLHNSTAGFRVGRWCCRTLHETFQTSDWASLGQLVPSAPPPHLSELGACDFIHLHPTATTTNHPPIWKPSPTFSLGLQFQQRAASSVWRC